MGRPRVDSVRITVKKSTLDMVRILNSVSEEKLEKLINALKNELAK